MRSSGVVSFDMTPKTLGLNAELHQYLLAHSSPIDHVQQSLIDETSALGGISRMQIAPEQGAFMTTLTELLGVRFAVEVGTFTGYSALAIARGLPAGGRLLCCDVSEEWTAIGRRHWEQAGVSDRIELRIAPALDTLNGLPPTPNIDLAFIDADKVNYAKYYDAIKTRLAPNGVILVDNVLWGGRVIDSGVNDDDTLAIRAFNKMVVSDDEMVAVMLPISDGLTLVRRR